MKRWIAMGFVIFFCFKFTWVAGSYLYAGIKDPHTGEIALGLLLTAAALMTLFASVDFLRHDLPWARKGLNIGLYFYLIFRLIQFVGGSLGLVGLVTQVRTEAISASLLGVGISFLGWFVFELLPAIPIFWLIRQPIGM